jgi:hypothetical protein
MFGDDHIDEITDWQAEFIIRVGEDIKPFMGIKAKQLFVLEKSWLRGQPVNDAILTALLNAVMEERRLLLLGMPWANTSAMAPTTAAYFVYYLKNKITVTNLVALAVITRATALGNGREGREEEGRKALALYQSFYEEEKDNVQ